MNAEEFVKRSKEFDRQIKEARRAALCALTLDEKLDCINRAKILEKQKTDFRNKWNKENPVN